MLLLLTAFLSVVGVSSSDSDSMKARFCTRLRTFVFGSLSGDFSLLLVLEVVRFFLVLVFFFRASSSELADTKTLRSISDVLAVHIEK